MVKKLRENLEKELGDLRKDIGTVLTKDTLDIIKSKINSFLLSNTPDSPCSVESCRSLWSTMSFPDKFKWFLFNVFPLKSIGKELNSQISLFNALNRQNNPGNIVDVELPCYLEENPKSVIKTLMNIVPNQPLEYFETTYTVDDAK